MLFGFLERLLLLISTDIGWVVSDIEESIGSFFDGDILLRIEGIGLKEFWKGEIWVFAGHKRVSKVKYESNNKKIILEQINFIVCIFVNK